MRISGDKGLLRGSVIVLSALLMAATALTVPARPALALSELKPVPRDQTGETPQKDTAETEPAEDDASDPLQLPMPDPLVRQNEPVTTEPTVEENTGEEPQAPVEVIYDIEKAPEGVRRMRELIIEAAASGEIERLRPLLGKGVTETQVSAVETNEGPVETLKGLSGDPDGIEILAILIDVLATGFVHVGAGTPDDMYVWPYFAEKPLAALTAPEKVELLRIVTAGDVSDMLEFGSYNFYRVGITPDGQWKFFIAGD